MIFLFLAFFNLAFCSEAKNGKNVTFVANNGKENVRIVIEVMDNKARIKSTNNKRFEVIIDLKDKIEDRTVALIDHQEKFYINMTYKEIQAITSIKRMFLPSNNSKPIDIRSSGKTENKGGFLTYLYNARFEDTDVELEFSKEAADDLKEKVQYEEILKFIKDVDFSALGVGNSIFNAVQSFLTHSINYGVIASLSMYNMRMLFLESIIDVELDKKIFEIDPNYEKAGLERFMSIL